MLLVVGTLARPEDVSHTKIHCRVKPTQGRRDSNPQPPVLETDALPIEPLPLVHLPKPVNLNKLGGIGACVSMVVVSHPVGEHTRGQRRNANATSGDLPADGAVTRHTGSVKMGP